MSEIEIELYDNPDDGWRGKVAFADGAEPYAYVPRQVIVGGRRGREVLEESFSDRVDTIEPIFGSRDESDAGQFQRVTLSDDDDDVVRMVEDLRLEGVAAQPNHVLFADADCCCDCHPADTWGLCLDGSLQGSPLHGSPLHGSPLHGSPLHGSPLHGSPLHGSPLHGSATGHEHSSVRPASPLPASMLRPSSGATGPKVLVLDTGLAPSTLKPNSLDAEGDGLLWEDLPDFDNDGDLDPCAGHGTFIAGLINLLAPGSDITVRRVLTNYGDGREDAIAAAIDAASSEGFDLLNLSFGGYALHHMHLLAAAVRNVQRAGTVVVASAGNDGVCRTAFPAAFPGVIGVGAIGPYGPAPWSNYGPWVRACAPGVDIISYFYNGYTSNKAVPPDGVDPRTFAGWARWSGTSFSAPTVTAAIAREMQAAPTLSAAQAAANVVDAPGLLRIPGLGTVVNLS